MDTMGFWIHKTPSVTMKVDVCIEPEIVYVNYKNYDCFVYKNKMKDFIINKDHYAVQESRTCCLRRPSVRSTPQTLCRRDAAGGHVKIETCKKRI